MAMQPPPRLFVPDVEPLAAANRPAEPAAVGLMGAAPAAAAAAGGPRQELWEALTEEERGRRDRLRMLRHKYGLLASGDTPPAPRKQHWLTPRQRALLGQSPFVSESAVLRQREKVQYLGDKVDAYTEQARELTRRIEAARRYEQDGWEGVGGLNASQAAMLRRCCKELAEVEARLAAIEARLAAIAAEEEELHRRLRSPGLSAAEEREIKRRLADLGEERQRLEQEKAERLRRRDALQKMIGRLQSGEVEDSDADLDMQLRLALFGLSEATELFPWESDPDWLRVQMTPGWSYRLAEQTGRYLPPADSDPAGLAIAHAARYREAERNCMDLARQAASVAHEAVRADVAEEVEDASILYRKATVLLELAVEEAERARLALPRKLAASWSGKAREYWARADLLSGQDAIDNMFDMLDTDRDGTIALGEFREGWRYLEERVGLEANGGTRRGSFPRAVSEWGVLDVARWLNDEVGVGEWASHFVRSRVDGVLLATLDERDLAELGIGSGIARKKILLALAHLKDG